MKRLKTPDFLTDLYRDLRDRKLLIPAVGLVVTLVAVPVLLAKDSPSAAPPAPTPPAEATAAQPAVLTEQVGIRNYRERLEALKSKNPFKQKFALPTPESVALADQGTGSTPATGSTNGTVDTGTTSASSGSVGTDTGSTAPSEPVSQPTQGGVRQTRKLITRVVDVTLGPLGETKQYENVRTTDVLPSNELPIVAYFGASPNSKRAAFLLSAGVVSSDGDGNCSPTPTSCYFLTMKPGDQRYLHFQPEGEEEEVIYRFKLKRVEEKVVKGSRQAL
jgi:hypothetical protein